MAALSVGFWAVVDIDIAVGLMIRKYAALACWVAVGVSLFLLRSIHDFCSQSLE